MSKKKVELDPTPTEAADGKKSPSYPRLEADVVDAFGQKAYGVPKGTSKSANENEIGCDTANAADLLPGEKVLAPRAPPRCCGAICLLMLLRARAVADF